MTASFEYHSQLTSERWPPLYAMAKNSICISAFTPFIHKLKHWGHENMVLSAFLGSHGKQQKTTTWYFSWKSEKVWTCWRKYKSITFTCQSHYFSQYSLSLSLFSVRNQAGSKLVAAPSCEDKFAMFASCAITFTFHIHTFTFHKHHFHLSESEIRLFQN